MGVAPTRRSISWPSFSTSGVGMLRTLKRDAVIGFSSTLSFPTRTPDKLARKLLDYRSDHSTRPAPRRPHVQQHGNWRPLAFFREVRISDDYRMRRCRERLLASPANGLLSLNELIRWNAILRAARGTLDDQCFSCCAHRDILNHVSVFRPRRAFTRAPTHCGMPIRLSKLWKRGSVRTLSKSGSTFSQSNKNERSRYALSSQAKACSLSPKPA